METKICTVCGVDKPLDQYRKYNGRGRFGLRPLCVICQRAYEKQWRSNSKENRADSRLRGAEKRDQSSRIWREANRAAYLVAGAKRRSVKGCIPFDLDQYVDDLQHRISLGRCEVSGIELDLSAAPGRRFNAPSLDRKNPKAGYVISNIRIVAFAVNAMLGDWGEDVALAVFAQWQKRVSDDPCIL